MPVLISFTSIAIVHFLAVITGVIITTGPKPCCLALAVVLVVGRHWRLLLTGLAWPMGQSQVV